ncbi:hypothetical protein PDESU_05500 [Pontiella desulfatans]|uniref:Uncharacterized protein n=1 Tax=Pontiella desulfatans TaxID=2750659 RepID=A0A6C2U9Y6_PONDE|nr:hypothetical protein [Pontiella desulfatans]VGO16908.1 hypothetical protein PDESU_05500 [Pontiella desulfatans]
MYDDDYDEYGDYPPRPRRPVRRLRVSLQWKFALGALLVLMLVSLRFCSRGRQKPNTELPRTQTVKVVSWQEVDVRIRAAVLSAHDKAVRHAETAVGQWIRQLRSRTDGYCEYVLSYWNQNAWAMKSIGYVLADLPPVEALAGEQPSARERLGKQIEEAYAARVLQPQSAQLKVEAVTRECIEVYLLELSTQLKGLQADFMIPDMEWERHLANVSDLTLAIIEGGPRQVPVVTKATIAGGGLAVARVARASAGQVRALVLRTTGKHLVEGGAGMVGRKVVRGGAWWLAVGLMAWDVVDHARLRHENEPVLRAALNGYLDELELYVLHDPDAGIIQTLERVQREMLRELEESESGKGEP